MSVGRQVQGEDWCSRESGWISPSQSPGGPSVCAELLITNGSSLSVESKVVMLATQPEQVVIAPNTLSESDPVSSPGSVTLLALPDRLAYAVCHRRASAGFGSPVLRWSIPPACRLDSRALQGLCMVACIPPDDAEMWVARPRHPICPSGTPPGLRRRPHIALSAVRVPCGGPPGTVLFLKPSRRARGVQCLLPHRGNFLHSSPLPFSGRDTLIIDTSNAPCGSRGYACLRIALPSIRRFPSASGAVAVGLVVAVCGEGDANSIGPRMCGRGYRWTLPLRYPRYVCVRFSGEKVRSSGGLQRLKEDQRGGWIGSTGEPLVVSGYPACSVSLLLKERSHGRGVFFPLIRLRPQITRDDPLNLSILLSRGKETNKDSLSSCKRRGKSQELNPCPSGGRGKCGVQKTTCPCRLWIDQEGRWLTAPASTSRHQGGDRLA
ncbi:hypothetical protein CRENBAI_025193 [Crenichthys baileyi]|uniref:Uncharacterized protein n=1 Tax=Crenichthys baileyi TaxID=28760 RepID=A0AAV9RHJ4_9TELE